MGRQTPKNKLAIYLIKEEFLEDKDILKNIASLQSINLGDSGIIYFGDSFKFPPSWVNKFFGSSLGNSANKLFNSSSKAILLINVKVADDKERIFAIPFGYGWTLINPGVWEERFGLKTALNVIDPNNLRSIDKNNMSLIPKIASEQLTKDGTFADFGIDIEQDLIRSVTGKTKDEKFGAIVTGKDALHLSVEINLGNIRDFLKLCFEKFESEDYKKDFSWIDQISELKNPKIKEWLNDKIITGIKSGSFDKAWMAVPELIDWADISGFSYKDKNENLKNDIFLSDFLSSLSDAKKQNLSLKELKRKIYCFGASNDEVKYSWSAYNCLYCEIQDDAKQKTYILSNGEWYEIESNFANQVNSDYQKMRDVQPSVSLPPFKGKNENEYNESVAKNNDNFYCFDKDLIMHGGGRGKIEFCDLYAKNRKIIHVKKYGGSSVLSHLFSQGIVSGELFIADGEFRKKVNEKLPADRKISNPEINPVPSDFEIVFAVISSLSKKLDIPFFSKVNFRNAKRRLETFGYKVSLQKVEVE